MRGRRGTKKVSTPMRFRPKSLTMLQNLEDWRAKAFMDPNDGWTIGWGRMQNVKEGDTTTKAKETKWMTEYIEHLEEFMKGMVRVPLNDQQHDAMVIFIYNIGTGQFVNSTLRRRLNEGVYGEVPAQMARWIYDDGVVVPGLMIRRAYTIRLWQSDLVKK